MVSSVNGTVFGVSNAVANEIGEVPFGDADALLQSLSKEKAVDFGLVSHSIIRCIVFCWPIGRALRRAFNRRDHRAPPSYG